MRNEQTIWCVYCQFDVPVASLKHWHNDADEIEFLCPGCDNDQLCPREHISDYIERVDREQRRQADENFSNLKEQNE